MEKGSRSASAYDVHNISCAGYVRAHLGYVQAFGVVVHNGLRRVSPCGEREWVRLHRPELPAHGLRRLGWRGVWLYRAFYCRTL